jgi:hypothetical protein
VGSSGGLINNTNGGNYNFSSSDGESTSNADFTEANPSRTFLTKTEITNNTAQEIYRTNKPEKTSDSIDDVKFTVEAKAQENAPA